jgi:integrase/recombinase XerD
MKLTEAVVRSLWETHMAARGLEVNSQHSGRTNFGMFARYLRLTHGEDYDWRDVTADEGIRYLTWLQEEAARLQGGERYSRATIALAVSTVRRVFALLWKQKRILVNPMRDLKVIEPRSSVRECLDEAEMERFLASIPTLTWMGLRDRALFELMYSSGLRPGEAAQVKVEDVRLDDRFIRIPQSKTGRERTVPVTARASRYLARLMAERGPEDYLFSPTTARPLRREIVNEQFQAWLKVAEISRQGLTAHSIRHSCAKHLLAHGADLRYVQQLLGHTTIETTVIYTNELTENLKKWHRTYHPRETVLWREVDDAYRAKVDGLKQAIVAERWRFKRNRPKLIAQGYEKLARTDYII